MPWIPGKPAKPMVAASALALLCATAPLSPQEDLSASFGEVIDIRVINLDVVVTDRNGDRVTGLGPEDFRLLVDGEEVSIAYFTEVRDGRARETVGADERSATVFRRNLRWQTRDRLGVEMLAAASAITRFDPVSGRKVFVLLAGDWPASGALSPYSGRLDGPAFRYGFDVFRPFVETANLLGWTVYPVGISPRFAPSGSSGIRAGAVLGDRGSPRAVGRVTSTWRRRAPASSTSRGSGSPPARPRPGGDSTHVAARSSPSPSHTRRPTVGPRASWRSSREALFTPSRLPKRWRSCLRRRGPMAGRSSRRLRRVRLERRPRWRWTAKRWASSRIAWRSWRPASSRGRRSGSGSSGR